MDTIDEAQTAETRDEDVHEAYYSGISAMDAMGLVDIGMIAAWDVSSYKKGYGTTEMRKDDPQLYWQSDGSLPHSLDILFSKKVEISRVCVYINCSLDESYTPHRLELLAGTGYFDLQKVATLELRKPIGWFHFETSHLSDDGILRPYLLRIKIYSNHDNGKDSHIRGVRVMAPKSIMGFNRHVDNPLDATSQPLPFTSVEFLSESVIR